MENNFEILYTPISKDDLIDIFDYIAEDNVDAAIHLMSQIEQSITNLINFPYTGTIPSDSQLRIKGYRVLFIGNHAIFYKPNISKQTITIYRVLSTYRDYNDLLQ